MHPEFLREGTAVKDFYEPPFVVIGEEAASGGDLVARMYEGLDAPIERATYEVAEMLKYSCNAFHALKVSFANEIGSLAKSLGVDGHRVMQLFAMDTKLNVSPACPALPLAAPACPRTSACSCTPPGSAIWLFRC
jgi:GDP-mannose 6-dehydrogenase